MKLPSLRQDLVFLALGLGVLGLLGRLGWMIHGQASAPAERSSAIRQQVDSARRGRRIVLPLPARPGNLFGRSRHSYVLLAGSRQVPSCFADVKLMSLKEIGDIAAQLALITRQDPGELYARLMARRNDRFVWVAREITREQARRIEDLDLRPVGIQYEWRREYPNGSLAGEVIGFCQKDRTPGGGLELEAAPVLSPRDGLRVLRGDAYRRPIWSAEDETRKPRDGGNVYTSIDVVIQRLLQSAVAESVEKYGAKWGTGVVLNPWTGDVLAMASTPAFDPNAFNTTPPEHMLNRCIASPYEPGSVFKPLITATAVQAGLMTYATRIDCEGGVYHAHRGGRISDHGQHFGLLSLADIVIRSSNIGMAKVGEKLGNAGLYRAVRQWGFGETTGMALPGETAGIVRDLDTWDGYSLRRVPFGQEIAASTLQLALAFGAVANGGVLMQPRLVRRITDATGEREKTFPPRRVRRVICESVARQTREVMRQVIDSPHGTGKRCRLSRWSAWGKTGTAQIPGPGGYVDGAYTGSFVAGAPVENPAAVCLISIYWPDRSKGYYGSIVAAPYVKEVLEGTLEHLNISPDRPEGR